MGRLFPTDHGDVHHVLAVTQFAVPALAPVRRVAVDEAGVGLRVRLRAAGQLDRRRGPRLPVVRTPVGVSGWTRATSLVATPCPGTAPAST